MAAHKEPVNHANGWPNGKLYSIAGLFHLPSFTT
jgi:hypothetical protein